MPISALPGQHATPSPISAMPATRATVTATPRDVLAQQESRDERWNRQQRDAGRGFARRSKQERPSHRVDPALQRITRPGEGLVQHLPLYRRQLFVAEVEGHLVDLPGAN